MGYWVSWRWYWPRFGGFMVVGCEASSWKLDLQSCPKLHDRQGLSTSPRLAPFLPARYCGLCLQHPPHLGRSAG